MATLTTIKNKANTKLTEFWPVYVEEQDSYYSKHAKYFQFKITGSGVDGEETTFELIKPSDEAHPSDVNLKFDAPIPFQIKGDEWTNSDEAGYSVTVAVELLNGNIYTRTHNNLNEDTGWSKVIEIE